MTPMWFSASFGVGTRLFELLTPAAFDTLAEENGAAIIHTYLRHYGKSSGQLVHPRFLAIVRALADRDDAWVVPVVTLLDRLRLIRQVKVHVMNRVISLTNTASGAIEHIALRVPATLDIRHMDGRQLPRRPDGQLSLGNLAPQQTVWFIANTNLTVTEIPTPQPNYSRLASGYFARVAWQFLHGRETWCSDGIPTYVRNLRDDAVVANRHDSTTLDRV